MMFGGRSNIVEWSRGEPESRRGQPTDPGEVGRKFFEKWESSGCNKKAHRWYASFCLSLTFRFIFGTFRSGGVARFVLRIIIGVGGPAISYTFSSHSDIFGHSFEVPY